jgi:hypothetical protein
LVDSLDGRDFYISESLLDPCHLERPVAYQTAYSSSRWGSRRLTPGELGNAFGLPARLSLGGLEEGMFPFVPVQVLMGCLDSLIQSNIPVLQPLSTPARRILAPVPTSTWLPNIQKRLDHAWIDQTAVSAKAAKSDASRVPTHLWDQRILLPLPGVHGGLPFLRSRLMRFQRLRLYTEFRTYMAATHGADWSGQLMAL